MVLNLLAKAIGVEQVTWAEVVLALSLSVCAYFFLVMVLCLGE